jgi:hypothetical protein
MTPVKQLMRALPLALILAFWACAASGEDATATVKQEAQKCAKAALSSDYEAIVRYTHPRIVKGIGGKEAMISALKKGMAQMRAAGTEFADVGLGEPEAPKKIGAWMTSRIPQHLVMKVPGGKFYQDSTLLGISEDEGKSWLFLDLGSVTREQFRQVFPELDGRITIPQKKEPEFKKDGA